MNQLICPISADKVYDAIPRIVALSVVVLLVVFAIKPTILVPLFLLVDFALRSFEKGEYSLLTIVATKISTVTNIKGVQINKAPKVFAARLGLVLSLLIFGTYLLGFAQLSFALALVLGFCAGLELVFNFCLGCYIYTYLILPFNKN